MKLDNLEKEEKRLFDLFHPMPNNNERDRLFKRWVEIRDKINLTIYKEK